MAAAGDVNKDGVMDFITAQPTGNPNGSINYKAALGVPNLAGKGTGNFNYQLTNVQNNTPVFQLMIGAVDGN